MVMINLSVISTPFYILKSKRSRSLCNYISYSSLGILAIVSAATVVASVSASSSFTSSNNYSPYQYDLTIPQFTPDGRLLQVEYSQKASIEHSIPIIVATTTIFDRYTPHDDEKNTSKYGDQQEQITIMIAGHRTRTGQQSRLILLPSKITTMCNSSSNSNSCESMMVIAISGILSDALAILQMIQSFRIQEYRTMGASSSISIDSSTSSTTMIRRIAYRIASTCQSRTITGGKRPYGATLWIMSTNSNNNNNNMHRQQRPLPLLLHQIDPSGAIYDIVLQPPSCSIVQSDVESKPMDAAIAVRVLGGSATISAKVQRRLQKDWLTMSHQISSNKISSHNGQDCLSTKIVQSRVGNLISIVLEEYQNHYTLKTNDNDSQIETTMINKQSIGSFYDHLEVVLISSKRGIMKLTSPQIEYFVQQYKAQKQD